VSTTARRRRLRCAGAIVLALAAAWYASSLAVGYALSRRLGDPEVEHAPRPDGVAVEELELRPENGAAVRAWL